MPSLPTGNMTANWDASVPSSLYASISGTPGVPTGSVSSGDQIGAWTSSINANHVWRPFDSATVFRPWDITWENDSVLNRPSVKIHRGTMEAVLASNGNVLRTSDFHTASAKTLAFSFVIEDAALLTNNATGYLNLNLVGEPTNAFYGTYLRNNGGTITLYVYNWAGSPGQFVTFTVTLGTPYVLVLTHDGTDLKAWLLDVSSTVAGTPASSGATTTITTQWTSCGSNAAGSQQVEARLGQITTWNIAQTGTNLQDIKDYYYDKWLLPPTNTGPLVNAGIDQTHSIDPVDLPWTITLNGSAIDDGLPSPPGALTYAWVQTAGPPATINSPTSASTTVDLSAFGVYVFKLTADDSALTGSDTIRITVAQNTPTGYVLTVGGQITQFLVETLNARAATNALDTLSVQLLKSDISLVVPRNAEVTLDLNGERVFGGVLNLPRYRGFGNIGWVQINEELNAVDFNIYAKRRVVTTNLPVGSTTALDIPITSSNVANPTTVTTSTPHGLVTGDDVVIQNHVLLTSAGSEAYGFLATTGNFSDGDTVSIDSQTYTFEAVFSDTADNVLIGATADDSLANLIAAINGAAGAGSIYGTGTTPVASVTAAPWVSGTIAVRYNTIGTVGNGTPVAETSATAFWHHEGGISITELGGGVDPFGGAGGVSPLNGSYTVTVTGLNTFTVPFNNTADGYGGTVRLAFVLKDFLVDIISTYLGPMGVVLHPSQEDGPAVAGIAVSYDQTVFDILNTLSDLTGWVWEIDYFKQLRMWAPVDVPAPFNVTDDDGHVIGDMSVEYDKDFANAIIFVAGGTGPGAVVTDTVVEDGIPAGGLKQYQFQYLAMDDYQGTWPNVLIISGVNNGPVNWGLPNAFFAWGWDWRTQSLYHDESAGVTPSAGATLTATYQSRYPIVVERTDPSIASGRFDKVVKDDSIKTIDVAIAKADAELADAIEEPRQIQYPTETPGLHPGMVQHVDSPIRGIDADFMITEVNTVNDVSDRIRYNITAIEGVRFRGTWRELLESWNR